MQDLLKIDFKLNNKLTVAINCIHVSGYFVITILKDILVCTIMFNNVYRKIVNESSLYIYNSLLFAVLAIHLNNTITRIQLC